MGSSQPKAGIVLQPGDVLGRHELLCVLAQGGMGTVWLARATEGAERLFAVKTILPAHSEADAFRTMFLDEANIASRIRHENVVRIDEVGEAKGVLYFVMEFVDGHSLRELQRALQEAEVEFPLGPLLHVFREACRGLHAVHELVDVHGAPLDVVHRDVSPQNLLIAADGTLKLIDFGVAKARDRLSQETAAGAPQGKLDYMALEQAQGGELDRRADVYALGAVLYDMVMGRPPRDSARRGPVQVLHDLALEIAPTPIDPRVPRPVAAVIERALAHRPEARFASCAEFERALTHAMAACGLTGTREDVARAVAECGGGGRGGVRRRRGAATAAARALDNRWGTSRVLRAPSVPGGIALELEDSSANAAARAADDGGAALAATREGRGGLSETIFGTVTLLAIVAGMTLPSPARPLAAASPARLTMTTPAIAIAPEADAADAGSPSPPTPPPRSPTAAASRGSREPMPR